MHVLSVMKSRVAPVLVAALALGGCADDLRDENMQQPDLGTAPTSRVKVTDEGGVRRAEVNATAMDQWVYLRLDTGAEVTVSDAQAPASREWDVALKRYYIKTNGGVSGGCGSEVAIQTGTDFAALTKAPASGYISDQADSADDGTEPDYALNQGMGWYDYNVMTHALTPRAQVYVVKACTGGYVKLQMMGYYDGAGSSGYPSFRVASVGAP